MKMKAWVLHDIGDFRYEEVEKPVPNQDEVLIKVKAAGVCGSDIPRIYRDGAHKMPLIPGHEFSGEVVEVGNLKDASLVGKRMGIFPLIPCNECVACKSGRHEMCRNYSYLGSRRDGGFAEYVTVPKANLIELPENVTYEQAAMLEPMAVAVHAMRRVDINLDDVVVVCGLGTIGLLLTMFLIERGIKNIFVIGNKDFQKQNAMELGIKEECYCDSKTDDVKGWILEHTTAGPDVFFECVGRNETVSQAINFTTPGGKVCLVGNPYSDMTIDKQTYWKILRNQLEVTGTWNSSFFCKIDGEDETDWEFVIGLLEEKKIKPEVFISHSYEMKSIDDGMKIMRDKKEDYLKAIGRS